MEAELGDEQIDKIMSQLLSQVKFGLEDYQLLYEEMAELIAAAINIRSNRLIGGIHLVDHRPHRSPGYSWCGRAEGGE